MEKEYEMALNFMERTDKLNQRLVCAIIAICLIFCMTLGFFVNKVYTYDYPDNVNQNQNIQRVEVGK